MRSRKFKPYKLNCGEGYIAEVVKGAYIRVDENGEFHLTDDIRDAYIGVEREMIDEARNHYENITILTEQQKKCFPRLFKVKKELTIKGEWVLDFGE